VSWLINIFSNTHLSLSEFHRLLSLVFQSSLLRKPLASHFYSVSLFDFNFLDLLATLYSQINNLHFQSSFTLILNDSLYFVTIFTVLPGRRRPLFYLIITGYINSLLHHPLEFSFLFQIKCYYHYRFHQEVPDVNLETTFENYLNVYQSKFRDVSIIAGSNHEFML
jgi:hypothetical protein